jgi:hypothetical protein
MRRIELPEGTGYEAGFELTSAEEAMVYIRDTEGVLLESKSTEPRSEFPAATFFTFTSKDRKTMFYLSLQVFNQIRGNFTRAVFYSLKPEG